MFITNSKTQFSFFNIEIEVYNTTIKTSVKDRMKDMEDADCIPWIG